MIGGSLVRVVSKMVHSDPGSVCGKSAFRATYSAATAAQLTAAGVVFHDVVFDKRILAPAVALESNDASRGIMGAGKSYVSEPSQLGQGCTTWNKIQIYRYLPVPVFHPRSTTKSELQRT